MNAVKGLIYSRVRDDDNAKNRVQVVHDCHKSKIHTLPVDDHNISANRVRGLRDPLQKLKRPSQ